MDDFGRGHFLVGIHEVGDLALLAEQAVLALVVVFDSYNAVEANGLTHGIHLGHFGVVSLEPCPQGHGHFQTESGAAGNPQLFQAENAVDEAGGKGQCQQRVDGEAALEQIAQTVQHQVGAQQGGDQHGQHLAENHQLHPVFRHQLQSKQGGDAPADQHHQQIQQHSCLKFAHAHFGQLIIPAFRAGHQLFFQLLQTGAGGEYDGGGDEFLLHLKSGFSHRWLRDFRFLRQIHDDGWLIGGRNSGSRLVGGNGIGGRFLHRGEFLGVGKGRFLRLLGFRLFGFRRFRLLQQLLIKPQLGHLPGGLRRFFRFRVLAEFLQNVL